MIKQKNKTIKLSAIIISIIVAIVFFAEGKKAQAGNQINITAYVINKDGKAMSDGDYDVRFSVYSKDRKETDLYPSDSDAASRIWQETQKISIYDGIMNVYLGSINPFPDNLDFVAGDYYLGIRIGSDSEMAPRKKLGAVPSAINSSFLQGKKVGNQPGDIVALTSNGELDSKILAEINQVGTISQGTWEGDLISNNFIEKNLIGKTYNGLNLTATVNQFTLFSDISNVLTLENGFLSLSQMGNAGSIVYSDGTRFNFSEPGTTGQVLVSNGSGAPVWGSVSGGIITADSLDFTELTDSMTLDDDLSINATTNNYSINFDSNTLFVDTANNRIGIGTNSPTETLSVSGDAIISGTLEASSLIISGGATIGTLGLNISMSSSLVPSTTGLNLGSSTSHWSNIYVDNLSVGGTDANGTTSEYFTINSDSTMEENIGLRFYRSSLNGYAALIWNASDLRFDLFKRENASTFADLNLNNLYADGNVGIGTTTPTAYLDIKSGTATANTAPIKLTAGTNLTTAEVGAFEYDGTELYFTPSGTTRETVAYISDIAAFAHDALTLGTSTNGLSLAAGQVLSLDLASSTTNGALSSGDWSTFNSKENALTFSTGLTRAIDTITIDLSTGVSGGQTLIGSTSTNSGLTIKSTTGVGTIGADIIFQVGDNGATEAMRILNSGYIGIGTIAPSTALQIGTLTPSNITTSGNSLMVSGDLEVGGSMFIGPMTFPTDSGAITWIDMPVSTSVTADTVESYTASLGGIGVLTIYGEALGSAGGVDATRVGIGVTNPANLLSIQQVGTAKANTNMFSITNSGNAVDMDGTRSSILFNQYYYSATAPTLVDSGNISVGTETDWTATASTQDSFMSFSNVLDGAMTERMRINSAGNVGIGTTSPSEMLSIGSSASYFNVTSVGDVYANQQTLNGSSTTNGTGTSSATLILQTSGGTNFDIGNYIKVDSTDCVSGVNTCYAKITNKSSDTLTISPSISWANGSTVTEVHIPEIGGTNLASTLSNRFGRGYFIDGIVTGNGTTYFTDKGVASIEDYTINASQLVVKQSNGYIGIGTDNPSTMLNINGTVGALTGGLSFGDGDTGWYEQADDNFRLQTAGSDRITVDTSGNVGIGTTTPSAMLSVGATSQFQVNTSGLIGLGGSTPLFSLGVDTDGSFKIYSGNGITGTSEFVMSADGTTSISNLQLGTQVFEENSGAISWMDMSVTSAAADNTIESYTAQLDGNPMITIYGLSDGAGGVDNLGVGIGTTSPTALLHLASVAGKVGFELNSNEVTPTNNVLMIRSNVAGVEDAIFRVQANGAVYADNAYTNPGADYAEYFKTKDTNLESGEAVCIDPQNESAVVRCIRNGDNNIMGVVSSNPSIIGNSEDGRENDQNYKVIAMMGQIQGNVSTENGEIKIGDSLTASSDPGYMRKANAGESTVGVAMQNFNGIKGKVQILISRRNQSLTVEKVEEAVTQNIANMNLQDQVGNIVSQASENLNKQIETLSTTFSDTQKSIITAQVAIVADPIVVMQNKLRSQMDLISEQNKAITDFITSLDMTGNDEFGNISLMRGKLEVGEAVTGLVTIKVIDEEAPTIGEAIIYPVAKDDDGDGEDDYTGKLMDGNEIQDRNGKSIFIETKAVSMTAKVFINFENNPKAFSWAEKEKADGEYKGFRIMLDKEVVAPVKVNWWIVEAE